MLPRPFSDPRLFVQDQCFAVCSMQDQDFDLKEIPKSRLVVEATPRPKLWAYWHCLYFFNEHAIYSVLKAHRDQDYSFKTKTIFQSSKQLVTKTIRSRPRLYSVLKATRDQDQDKTHDTAISLMQFRVDIILFASLWKVKCFWRYKHQSYYK